MGIPTKRKQIITGAVIILVTVYACAYETLRATHVITDCSNVANWDPEKWEAGHHVSVGSNVLGLQLLDVLFRPASFIEEECRNILDWFAGPPGPEPRR